MVVLVVLLAVLLVGYRISLTLHPYTTCELCRQTGRNHSGGVFGYAFRPCYACRGRGAKQRWGARMLGLGEPRNPRQRGKFAPPTSNWPTPPRRRYFGIF